MSEPVLGMVHHNTICVEVRWIYITSSASIVILVLLFFVATVSHTRFAEGYAPDLVYPEENDSPLDIAYHDLRSSALATLLHGLDQCSLEEVGFAGSSNTVSKLETLSKEYLVTLVFTEHGWKLSTVRR